ncbi:MAG: hypothetical protein EOO02_11395 [Chitinophagaceae bacterium]|nr:MAG: hypothetical protein EOO02_11395 [Chitinophagaceae bacterium]
MKMILIGLLVAGSTIALNSKPVQTTSTTATTKDSLLTMLTYGMPVRGIYGETVHQVALKYGFRYYAVAGCVVTENLVDSVRKENDKVSMQIAMRYGINWKEQFEKDIQHQLEINKKEGK